MDRYETPDLFFLVKFKLKELVSDIRLIKMYLNENIELEGIALRTLDASQTIKVILDMISNQYKNIVLEVNNENEEDDENEDIEC